MPSCSAYGCTNRSQDARRIGVTFHRFPKDPRRVREWVVRMKWDKWTPTPNSRVCSRHFEEKYLDRSQATVRLHEKAVPTIFSFPARFQKKSVPRKHRKREVSAGSTESPGSAPESSPSNASGINRPTQNVTAIDHNYALMESAVKLKHRLNHMCDQLELYQKKLKLAQQKVQRLTKRVSRMASIIQSQKEGRTVSVNGADVRQVTVAPDEETALDHSSDEMNMEDPP